MKIQHQLEELYSNKPLKINKVKSWLVGNEEYLKYLINNTSCCKWKNWINDRDSFVFSCCSNQKEINCQLIEVFYVINKIVIMFNRQNVLAEAIAEYQKIEKDNHSKTYVWAQKNNTLIEFIGLNPEVNVKTESGLDLYLELDPSDFSVLVEFNKILTSILETEEFQILEGLLNDFEQN